MLGEVGAKKRFKFAVHQFLTLIINSIENKKIIVVLCSYSKGTF